MGIKVLKEMSNTGIILEYAKIKEITFYPDKKELILGIEFFVSSDKRFDNFESVSFTRVLIEKVEMEAGLIISPNLQDISYEALKQAVNNGLDTGFEIIEDIFEEGQLPKEALSETVLVLKEPEPEPEEQ